MMLVPTPQFTDLVGYDHNRVQLAQQILYTLGIRAADGLPDLKKDEKLGDYLDRLNPKQLATVEGLGAAQGREMAQTFETAAKTVLYEHYVSGRWRLYAEEFDTEHWSPYVKHVVDDLNLSESEGGRWAIALAVIAELYTAESKERYGLLYIGDPVVDGDTGEVLIVESIEGLPRTVQECLECHFNRYARAAGRKLRDLFREIRELPDIDWNTLLAYKEAGYLDDEILALKEKSWGRKEFADHRSRYEKVREVRRVLELATSPSLDNKQVDREATGGKSLMPTWTLPPDTPPAWQSLLKQEYPDVISDTGSLTMGQRYVQVRYTEWPRCRSCNTVMAIGIDRLYCPDCNGRSAGSRVATQWAWRVADEHGRYKSGWFTGRKPSIAERGTPEVLELNGLRVEMYEVTADLDEIDTL